MNHPQASQQTAERRAGSWVRRYFPTWPALQLLGIATLVIFWAVAPTGGFDAASYHSLNIEDPYRVGWHEPGSFVYPPPTAWAFWPFTLLPFEVFEKTLMAANLAGLAWLLSPLWAAVSLAFLPVHSELLTGQIHTLLAVALVLALRYPAAWTAILLTKVTPGVAIAWHLVRREWRHAAVALGVTAAICLASFVLWPSAWSDWIELARSAPDKDADYIVTEYPLVARVTAAGILAALAGWRGRPAALPLIVLLAQPAVWFTGLTLAAAVPRLHAMTAESNVGGASNGL